MPVKTLLFLTTNFVWGGSEILWLSVAKRIAEQRYRVKIITGYELPDTKSFTIDSENFFIVKRQLPNLSFRQRIRQRLGWKDYSPQKKLEEFIAASGASLAIISQGNNTEGLGFMEILAKQNIPFATITQLVVQSVWPGQDDKRISQLKALFDKALINFFVSESTMQQHETFLGSRCPNGQIMYNPFTKGSNKPAPFPQLVNGRYAVALIGRLECYHKGYDLLIEVLASDKWKARNIVFHIYGEGPHRQLIERLLAMNDITNVKLKGHTEDIASVWQQHHLLLMPSRLEGQSLTLIEAMRFKRAAIVTNVGGVEELIEDDVNGFIAAFSSAEAIDEAMERAWQKRGDWETMGVKAHHAILAKHPADAVSYFIEQISPLLKEKAEAEQAGNVTENHFTHS